MKMPCQLIGAVEGQRVGAIKEMKPKPFSCGTGLMGGTESGQRVTANNASNLPAGSVVRLGNGSRLIRLHDDLWLYCNDHIHCYDRLDNLKWRIDREATACHVAPR